MMTDQVFDEMAASAVKEIQQLEARLRFLTAALAVLRRQCDHDYRLIRAPVGKRLPYRMARRMADFAAACEQADAILGQRR
jgi:hypothetical protein